MTPETTTRMTTIPANSSARRKRARANTSGLRGSSTARLLPFRGAQDVPGSAQCLDAAGCAGPVELATQAAHVHVHDVGESVVLLVPGVVEDAVAREHLPGVPHEQLEEAELLGAQRDLLAVAHHTALRRVQAEVADHESRRQRHRGPAQQGADARQKLLEDERLHQVVVGAAVQALSLIHISEPTRLGMISYA